MGSHSISLRIIRSFVILPYIPRIRSLDDALPSEEAGTALLLLPSDEDTKDTARCSNPPYQPSAPARSVSGSTICCHSASRAGSLPLQGTTAPTLRLPLGNDDGDTPDRPDRWGGIFLLAQVPILDSGDDDCCCCCCGGSVNDLVVFASVADWEPPACG